MNNPSLVRRLIWLYFLFLIWEGALRKWVFPGMSNIIIIARDPIVLAIYILSAKRFPWGSSIVIANFILAFTGFLASFGGGRFDPVVALYGMRVNFFHLPLIFVIPCYMNREHVVRMGKWFMIFSVPIVAMMAMQFDSNIDSPWNVGAGGGIGGQLKAAVGDKARASGPFSFVSGPILFFPVVAAFVLNGLTYRRQSPWILLALAGTACLLAVPVAISRSLFLGMIITALVYLVTTLLVPRLLPRGIKTCVLILVIFLTIGATRLFQEASGYLGQRWDEASEGGKGFYVNVVERVIGEVTIPSYYLTDVPIFGMGLGVGTNAGAKLLTGVNTFLLPEGEWGRIMFESGPLLGLAFIFLRIAIVILTFRRCWSRLREGDILPMLLWSACAMNIWFGQWGPPTSLGFAVLGGGLALAACRPAPEVRIPVSRFIRQPKSDEEPVLVPSTADGIERGQPARPALPSA